MMERKLIRKRIHEPKYMEKVRIFSGYRCYEYSNLEEDINNFIKDKEIIDIQILHTYRKDRITIEESIGAFIRYKEEKKDEQQSIQKGNKKTYRR